MDEYMDWKGFRNYEVSVWTLQDSYITTLKSGDSIYVRRSSDKEAIIWPQARARGQIQNGQMTLNIDGTQNFTFDIPMYLYINGQKQENPNWYNTVDQNILTSMRKIKVIFNKWDNIGNDDAMSNSTFEFIIVKVQEQHENDELKCHVECEGLAFHELGKIGYKRSLTTAQFNNEYNEWAEKVVGVDYSSEAEKLLNEPKANLQYWMSKAKIEYVPTIHHNDIVVEKLNPNKWYYQIKMVHSALDHDEETTPIANETGFIDARVIYENSYVSDWTSDGVPLNYAEAREKYRLVDINESNLYNITQDLAEKFEVFCRYQYYYDNNYNIIGRVIVFYNNFLEENKGVTTLMYPNSASRIQREMDSTDISTKMFIRSVETSDLYEGIISIMDCNANKTREDYLLNFDYLHDIGTISDEQYSAISDFEVTIRKINDKFIPIQEVYKDLSTLKTEVDAKVKILEESIALDQERITENVAKIDAIDRTDGVADGYITIDYRNPDTLYLMKDTSDDKFDSYYIEFNQNGKCGIDRESVELYENYNSTATSTFQYGLSFTNFSKPSNSTNTKSIAIPGSSNKIDWQDAELIYKGTIGSNPTVDTLPDNPSNGKAYKVLTQNYPTGYTVNVGQFLQYNSDKKKWEVTTGLNETNTIGKKPDTTSVAEATDREKGWFYKVITADAGISGTQIGDIVWFNGSSWVKLQKPSSIPEKNGFYIYKKEIRHQPNGLKTQIYTCTPKCRNGVTTDYITKIMNVYYVSLTQQTLSAPKIESAKTKATDIKSNNVLDKWSTVFSLPDDITNGYYAYTSAEISHSQNNKEYLSVSGPLTQDGTGTSIATAISDKKAIVLTNQIFGEFQNDEYGNLSKVINLYKTPKSGIYSKYGTKSGGLSASSISSYSNTVNAINGLTINETSFPDAKSTYIVIQKENHHSNGNITYSYIFKYVDENGVAVEPPDSDKTKVAEIAPIFYLKSNDKELPAPTSKNVVTTQVENSWTTFLPNKIKNSQKYYSGYKITKYNNSAIYVYSSSENTSLKKARASTTAINVPTYIYVIYRYKPDLYYETIKKSWEQKLYQDKVDLVDYTAKQTKLKDLIEKIEAKLKEYSNEKDETISKFEYMMGAALRESYWQPEDEYQDYGTKYQEYLYLYNDAINTSNDATYVQNNTDGYFSYIGWDSNTFDDEDKLYYESSINQTRMFYPCIDLSALSKSGGYTFLTRYANWATANEPDEPYSFVFNPMVVPQGEDEDDIRYCQYYTIGSRAKLGFIYHNNQVKPVLILTDASSLSDQQLQYMYSTGKIAQLKSLPGYVQIKDNSTLTTEDLSRLYELSNNTYVLTNDETVNTSKTYYQIMYSLQLSKSTTYTINDSAWLNVNKVDDTWVEDESFKSCKMVYPRIIIPSLKLKNNTKDLNLNYNNIVLENYVDYYVLTKTYYTSSRELYDEKKVKTKKYLINSSLSTHPNVNDGNWSTQIPSLVSQDGNYLWTQKRLPRSSGTSRYVYEVQYIHNKKLYNIYNFENIEDAELTEELLDGNNFMTAYTITIKPETVFKYKMLSGKQIKIYYALSNADTNIYLDGKKILKENAYPKVSYEIDVSMWSKTLLENLHTKLAQIVMINDTDLKLQNTFGYISQVELDLDHQENDKVEVKNYKTKFEDLFSKIVAETEEMHKNSFNIGMAGAMVTGGGVDASINPDGFATTLSNKTNQDILKDFLDEYFDSAEVVQNTLKEMWDEAGSILGNAANSLNSVLNLTSKNALILESFRENVSAAMTPQIFTGPNEPTNFKPGDIWINGDYQGVATGYSGTGGFIRTHDGKLSEIVGASLDIDAEAGTIDILAETNINLMSGKDIYIAANDTVNIVGNKEVNIGGTTINMASSNITGDGYTGTRGGGGIHLVTVDYDFSNDTLTEGEISRVDINGTGIELASKNGIIIKSGGGIDIRSATNTAVSTIQVDNTKGIWIGSDKTISLFSGSGDVAGKESSGANVELSPTHLLLGVGSSGSATAIELSKDQIILAAGGNINSIKNTVITNDSDLSGVQIKKDYIGLATGTGNSRSIVSIQPQKILLGQANYKSGANNADDPSNYTGSYLWLAEDEVYIGSMGNFTLNTNNIKIQSKLLEQKTGSGTLTLGQPVSMGFALGRYLQGKNGNNDATPDVGLGFWITEDSNHNPVKHLVVDGDITARSFTLLDNNTFNITTTYDLVVIINGTEYNKTSYTSRPTSAQIKTYSDGLSAQTGITVDQKRANIYIKTTITTNLGTQSQSTIGYEHISAEGVMQTVLIDYAVSASNSIPSSGWDTDYSKIVGDLNVNTPFLVTRTRTFINGVWNYSYTYSKMVDDNQPYVISIKTLYLLQLTTASAPQKITGTTEITNSKDEIGAWTTTVPTYPNNASNTVKYRYYVCEQKKWANHNPILEWTSPVQDYGLTVANQNATSASIAAAAAASSVSPITSYGLTGPTTWNGNPYALVLGNNKSEPMLIGSNGGVTIVDTNLSSGQSGYGSAVVLAGSGISMHGSSIILDTASSSSGNTPSGSSSSSSSSLVLNNNGITMGTSGTITLLSTNFKVDSTETGNNSIFYVGTGGTATSDKYIKYSASGGLEVKGAITATSFILSGDAQTQFNNAVNNAVDTSNFTIDGLSVAYRKINSSIADLPSGTNVNNIPQFSSSNSYAKNAYVKYNSTNKNIYKFNKAHSGSWSTSDADLQFRRTVQLTSQNALVLGSNAGFYVLNDNDDSLADAKVSIIKTGINFDQDSSNYVHISSSGIEVSGTNIKINSENIWSHENIVIMNPNDSTSWRQTVSKIETHMSGVHDWVLIKPAYDAECEYSITGVGTDGGLSGGTYSMKRTDSTKYLGNNAGDYKYQFILQIRVNGSNKDKPNIFMNVDAYNGSASVSLPNKSGFYPNTDTNHSNYNLEIKSTDSNWTTLNANDGIYRYTGPKKTLNNVNIAAEGYETFVKLAAYGQASSNNYILTSFTLIVSCDATLSRVPCTVYYYP